jgi:hypothetical protein
VQRPGDVLQRFELGLWQDYQHEGQPVVFPFDLADLEPGRYRLWNADS